MDQAVNTVVPVSMGYVNLLQDSVHVRVAGRETIVTLVCLHSFLSLNSFCL